MPLKNLSRKNALNDLRRGLVLPPYQLLSMRRVVLPPCEKKVWNDWWLQMCVHMSMTFLRGKSTATQTHRLFSSLSFSWVGNNTSPDAPAQTNIILFFLFDPKTSLFSWQEANMITRTHMQTKVQHKATKSGLTITLEEIRASTHKHNRKQRTSTYGRTRQQCVWFFEERTGTANPKISISRMADKYDTAIFEKRGVNITVDQNIFMCIRFWK